MYVFDSGRRGWRGGEWMRGMGLALPILCEYGECFDSGGVGGVGRDWVRGLDQGLEGYCGIMSV